MNNNGYLSKMFTKINNLVLKNKMLRKLKSIYYYIDGLLLLFIKKPQYIENGKKKIVIVYNLFLGDGAMFNCAIKNLRKIYPKEKYEITIFCQSGLNKIYEKTEIFDYVYSCNFTKSITNLKTRIQTFKTLRKQKYDILLDPIDIEECSLNILMARAVCADKKIGVINISRKITCPKSIYQKVYTELIEVNDKKTHYLEHYTNYFNIIGKINEKVEFVNLPSQEKERKLPKEYCIVYPSASTEYKKWPVERFADIAKRVYKYKYIPILVCGTNVDKDINNRFIELIKNDVKYIDITGQTDLLEYISIIKRAKYIITNDTGIYHIAVVSEVPVSIISGVYTYDRFLTYNFKGKENFKQPYLIFKDCKYKNCGNRCMRENEINKTWPCLNEITVEDAWKVIKRMINESK